MFMFKMTNEFAEGKYDDIIVKDSPTANGLTVFIKQKIQF